MEAPHVVYIIDIVVEDRIRQDYGDITALAGSIKEFGIIQPIVLTISPDDFKPHLVAGGRRLKAMKSLGKTELRHGIEFVLNEELKNTTENFDYRKQSIEMEENLKRKDLSWQEQVLGKQRLLLLMQEIYGLPTQGRPSESQKNSSQPGFGVNKLSEMLGESKAQTSEDLELAALITKIPILQQQPSREAAKRQIELAIKIATGQSQPRVAQVLHYKIMIDCDDEAQQKTLIEQFRSVGLKCQPVIT